MAASSGKNSTMAGTCLNRFEVPEQGLIDRPPNSHSLIALRAPRAPRTKEEPVGEELLQGQEREIAEIRTAGNAFECLDPACGALPEAIDAVGVENERRAGATRKLAVNEICCRDRMRLRKPNHVAAQALHESCANPLGRRRVEPTAWPHRPGSEVPRFKDLL